MQSHTRGVVFLFMLGLLGLLFLVPMFVEPPPETRSYSEFLQDVRQGAVRSAVVEGSRVRATYAGGKEWRVHLPQGGSGVADLMVEHGVSVKFAGSADRTAWSILLSAMVPLVLIGAFIWFFARNSTGGAGTALSFGESRARLYHPDDKKVTMRDVAGIPEVKEELAEVVDFLRSPERYLELGARIPKGVLLSGPPGTGKTLLARAVAGEAAVPFFSISGSDFVEMFAGVGAARVRDLFTKAKEHAPCIVFVDEIDAVARQRGAGIGGGHEEREQTLNQLLVEMDGFSVNEGIIVMAATNRTDVLDTAILRAGRFDRQITVDPPDRQGRREILLVHALGKPLADDLEIDHIAGLTTGFTGADLANLLNEAALLAARHRKGAISMAEITAAFERVVTGGPALKRHLAQEERIRVAYHEAGHAVVSRSVKHGDRVAKVTIAPRGRALGYVMYTPREDQNLYSRSEIIDRIIVLLGGRAAEELVLGEVSTGASDDLERATGLARRMVADLGMSEAIGPVNVLTSTGPMAGWSRGPSVSERTVGAVDEAVRNLVLDCYHRALALVTERRDGLERIASALMERETLDGRDLDQLLAH